MRAALGQRRTRLEEGVRSWCAVLLLCAACWLATSSADFYSRVPVKSPVYDDLAKLAHAGYLGAWKRPNYNLLRLEVALLLQTALPEYYRSGFERGAKPELEGAVERLTDNFHDELLELGVQVTGVSDINDVDNPDSMPVELLGMVDRTPGRRDNAIEIEDKAVIDKGSRANPGMLKGSLRPTPKRLDVPSEVALLDGHDPAEEAPASFAEAPVRLPEPIPMPQPVVRDEPVFESLPSAIPQQPREYDRQPSIARDLQPVPELEPAARSAGYPSPGPERREINLLQWRDEQQAAATMPTETKSPGAAGHVQAPPSYVAGAAPHPAQRYARDIALSVEPFADIQGQALRQRTEGPGGSSAEYKARLYWGDAGLRFNGEDWGGQLTLNYNDRAGSAKLHELWIEARDERGGYACVGRTVLPFAERKGWFPTFSLARELGFTTANAAGVGWDEHNWGVNAWVYDSPGDKAGGGSGDLEDFAVNMELCNACCDDDENGWRLALAFMSELRGHEAKLAAAGAGGRVPAVGVSGGWEFDHGRFQLNADYTAALRRFNPGALDADGNGVGDRPGAFSVELLHTPTGLEFYGLRYEYSSQFAGRPSTRWSAMYGQWLSEEVLGRLELSRGGYNAHTPGRTHDLSLLADVNVVF